MTISTNGTIILNSLQHSDDPLTRAELAEIHNLTQQEVVQAINELSDIYEIQRLMSGYLLHKDEELPNLALASPRESILALLCNSAIRIYPRTICKRLGHPLRTVEANLSHLLTEKVVSYRVPGTYFLSAAAAEYISTHYPNLKINVAVQKQIPIQDNIDNYTFTINRKTAGNKAPAHKALPDTEPAEKQIHITLGGIAEKISLLQQLQKNQSGKTGRHLTEMINFLQHHTEQA